MALVICCPCGNPLECENLELVVTLVCPECGRELALEFEDDHKIRRRAVLTVMEGPHWIGEQFVIPVATQLRLGKGLGNWLALDGDKVSREHCHLRLTARGNAVIEDAGSTNGTWVGNQRVTKGRLKPKQSFRVGEFRLRFDYQDADGAPAAAATASSPDAGTLLPGLRKVIPDETPGHWLCRNRYHVSRWMITAFAWLTAVHHGHELWSARGWIWWAALLAGLVVFALLTELGRRVALLNPYAHYAALAALLLVAALDAFWQMPAGAIAALLLAIGLAILTTRIPTDVQSILAALLGTAAVTVVAVRACQGLMAILAHHA